MESLVSSQQMLCTTLIVQQALNPPLESASAGWTTGQPQNSISHPKQHVSEFRAQDRSCALSAKACFLCVSCYLVV